ncbi:NAD(+)--dinitrogen-reductase ADP-D-ribosyltransferase [Roseospira marina]|nr:NAD(+)--dinitrogen-reductase ADP-D-ribosyltransferase [Roseospira marina]MBB5085790.1 NAD+--dinitrogen-reductase ADP-D-ribosyltransferase [Roseospira marina]
MVGVTSAYLASPDFNDGNEPLDLPHVRATTRSFFDMLAEAEDIDDAVQAFHAYMAATFCLEPDQYDPIERKRKGNTGRAASDGTRRFRSSYLRLLKGWMFETGGAEGAVLKGWVESRFGLLPTWHGEPITHIPCTAWLKYVEQKMNSRFHDNAIHCQLDLVFTFCQWVLRRFVAGETQHLVLYRGVNPSGEDMILERTDRRHALVRFNNLTSFTADKTVAECFGDWIITARVPVAKVVFYADLLPRHPLKGEAEYLVIGGDYRVEMAPL